MGEDYTAQDLQVLEGLDAVRKRPGMYIGSTDSKGLTHCVWELVDNAVDEALAGFGDKIQVTLHADNSIEISDQGRGIPVDIEPTTGLSGVVLVLTRLHAGAKFGGAGYRISGGLHGVGLAVVNALAQRLDVTVTRDGKETKISFKHGEPGIYKNNKFVPTTKPVTKKAAATKKTGTTIRFWPDPKLFTPEAVINPETIGSRLQQTSYLIPGLTLILENRHTGQTPPTQTKFVSTGGLIDMVATQAGNTTLSKPIEISGDTTFKEIVPHTDPDTGETETVELERPLHINIALVWNNSYEPNIQGFVNVVATPKGGTHIQGFERGVTRGVQKSLTQLKLLKTGEETPTKDDIFEGLHAAVSVVLPEPQFEGQTKETLGTPQITNLVATLVEQFLIDWATKPKNQRQIKTSYQKIVTAARNRRDLRNKRDLLRRKTALQTASLPTKLKDCRDVGTPEAELLIVEGDSAMGTGLAARNSQHQALLPLRGKILNVLRSTEKAMLDNAECAAVISAIGAGVGTNFNLADLRYNKIIILCDADVDGSHIRSLLLTLFWKYLRPLIEHGHIYAAVPPLYRLQTQKTKENIYCFTDQDRTEKEQQLKTAGIKLSDNVQRFKGLGEMNADQLAETTLDPSTRMLRRITLKDAEKTAQLFEDLMGNNPKTRRDYISENSNLFDHKKLDI
ncbi:MAG: DNA topoisomerase IV subunit B [Acidimicrobiia bacterium]